MLGLGVRSSRRFYEPAEPDIEADLWYLGLLISACSAVVVVGGGLWFFRILITAFA